MGRQKGVGRIALKRVLAAITGAVILLGVFSYRVAADLSYADPNLIVFEDHFLNLDNTDTLRTTAFVDTTPPGYVTLKKAGGGVPFSLRPYKKEIAAVVKDGFKIIEFNGSAMTERVTLSLSGAKALAYSSSGNFLAVVSENAVHVYGFTDDGCPREVSLKTVSNVIAVTGFLNDSFLILTPNKVLCLAWNGSQWMGYPWAGIEGFTAATQLAFSPADNSLAVLDSGKLTYCRWDGDGFRKLASTTAQESLGVAVEGGGLRLLDAQGTRFYDTPQGTLAAFPELNDNVQGYAIAPSPWGIHDYALLTKNGIEYRAWSGSSLVMAPEYSVAGTFGGGSESYGPPSGNEGVYVSKPIPAKELCSRVRLEADWTGPAESSVKFELSTDGGNSFTEVLLNQNTPVPPGYQVVYKITLKTTGGAPKVDRVRLLQIGIKVIPAPLIDVNGRSRVRLVQ